MSQFICTDIEFSFLRLRQPRLRHHLIFDAQENAMAQPVCHDGEEQQDADHDRLHVVVDMGEIHTILDEANEHRTKNAIAEPTCPAAKTYTPDDAGGYRIKWQRRADIGLAGLESCRQ